MKLLNVGCGGQRPQDPIWTNLDELRTFLKPGTPERENLDKEENYVEHNLLSGFLPFAPETFDGVLMQHVIEHLTCHEAVDVLRHCRNVLKPGGFITVSVPDAEYFLRVYFEDNVDTAVHLFGEPISEPQYDKFFDYALFHREHKQVLTEESLACLLVKAGFSHPYGPRNEVGEIFYTHVYPLITRKHFSVILTKTKHGQAGTSKQLS